MIKGFIFDYGGTLDTGGNHWGRVLWHAYERHHIPVCEEQFREAYVTVERQLGNDSIIMPHYTFLETLETKILLQFQHLHLDEALATPLTRDIYAETFHQTAESIAVLYRLTERYPLVLVSNFYGNLSVVLREFGFDDLFRQVIESASVGLRKPDERIFLLGLQALQLPSDQVVVVGDSIKNDILPAQKLGCQTVWYQGEQWVNDTVTLACQPDKVITDLSELISNRNRSRNAGMSRSP